MSYARHTVPLEPSAAFDRLVRLARRVTDAAAALVTLDAGGRHLRVSGSGRELPPVSGVCARVLASGEPLAVEDLRCDARFRDTPAAAAGMAGYLGLPLRDSRGAVVGALCVMDDRPRRWSADARAALADVVDGALAEIALRAEIAERARAEAHYRRLAGTSPYAIYVRDAAGRITEVNAAAEEILGRTTSELLGLHISEVVAAEDLPVAQAAEMAGRADPFAAQDVRLRLVRPSGERRWVHVRAAPVLEDGEVVGYHGVIRDTTDEREMEEALRESEARFRAIFEGAGVGAALVSLEGRIVESNAALQQILGYGACELAGMAISDLTHPEDLATTAARFREVVEGKREHYFMHKRYLREDGAVIWGHLNASVVRDPAGRPQYLVGVLEDVTRRRETEAALQRQEEYLRALIEHSSDLLAVLNPDGSVRFTSPSAERLLGWTAAELEGRPLAELIHPEDLAAVLGTVQRTVCEPATPQRVAYRIRHRDGSWRRQEAIGQGLLHHAAVGGIVVNARDVTRQSRAEEALRESEEHFRSLIENAWDVIHTLDAEGRFLYVSPAIERVLGYAPHELLGRDSLELVHPDDAPAARSALARRADDPATQPALQARVLHRDGGWRHLEIVSRTATDASGRRVAIVNTHDVTRHRRAEAALRKSEERFRALFENSSDTVAVLDARARVRYATPSVERLFGHAAEALRGTDAFALVHPDDLDAVRARFQECLGSPGTGEGIQFRLRHADGSWRAVEAIGNNLLDHPAVQGVVLNCRDVTERYAAEAALRESEERFRQLTEGVEDVFWMTTRDFSRFLYVSPNYETVWGLSRDELYADSLSFLNALHPEDRGRMLAAMARIASGVETEVEYRIVLRGGDVRWLHSRGFPVLDAAGTFYRIAGISNDVTVQKVAERQLRERDAVLLAVSRTAEQLLRVSDWRAAVPGVLARLGEATQASRVYLMENYPSPGGAARISQRYE